MLHQRIDDARERAEEAEQGRANRERAQVTKAGVEAQLLGRELHVQSFRDRLLPFADETNADAHDLRQRRRILPAKCVRAGVIVLPQ